ncbi:DEAD/DEAH box helicase [Anaerocellum danielii]|uniref:DEAD/DEAH box helicase n=1 Tax=Anaerocellum danielii TaxID=1387557 RepID=A0ABZ0TWH1_9FIRM|nr:DEAD/DEAH box helicase [Caldicellulosiruptor danielii]WPX07808.1 DEAD/DEAH box helicase [Caldicellulosiruptor danielii]
MDNNYLEDLNIKSQLSYTWDMFFGGYGRLKDVQRKVIPKILEGKDVLICSPTASGKTEAACAPLIERLKSRFKVWTILYVCPTRALVNDIYERLYSRLVYFGIEILRKTGDYQTQFKAIPNIIITTPESFDSMMCRARLQNNFGHVLSCVYAIVLDEVHLLYGSSRGEQVRWLIERLRRLKAQAVREKWCEDERIQIVAMSATMKNPEKVLKYFVPNGEIVISHGKREINLVSDEIESIDKTIFKYFCNSDFQNRFKKILIFCNSRNKVDALTAKLRSLLKDSNYQIVSHHGSLVKSEREEVEEIVKKHERVIAISSSTFEIGIDIGSIDLIVLAEPPLDMNSFLQRIGRGNRKSDRIDVILCAEDDAQRLIQKAMLYCAQNGILFSEALGNIFHVVIQQILSYIFQSKEYKRSKDALTSLIKSCLNYYFEDLQVADDIIHNLISNSQLVQTDGDKLTVNREWFEKFANGQIHSTIRFASGMSIYDLEKNKVLATNVQDVQDKKIKIVGKNKSVVDVQGSSILVKNTSDKIDGGLVTYTPYETIFFNMQPYAVRAYLGIEDNECPYIIRDNKVYVFHLGSTQREFFIKLLIRAYNLKAVMEVNSFLVQFEKDNCKTIISFFKNFKNQGIYSLISFIERDIDRIEKDLKIDPLNKLLPLKVRIKEVLRILNIEEEIEILKKVKFYDASNTEIEEHLEKLIF